MPGKGCGQLVGAFRRAEAETSVMFKGPEEVGQDLPGPSSVQVDEILEDGEADALVSTEIFCPMSKCLLGVIAEKMAPALCGQEANVKGGSSRCCAQKRGFETVFVLGILSSAVI